ncbi:cytochrome P450 [Streptomyces yaizuensis]|uniref:Cytochrome P450 n=1 Tax=Streptomyces yaizuensis TaxID=2989713 RepID=A0ABQ5P2P0_9ACTN|nr:cytochrome P450 [Streptomyces sp. YSPA8]GLF96873.1 cytochrome P450 [Streptomyces sp. YSPA8]
MRTDGRGGAPGPPVSLALADQDPTHAALMGWWAFMREHAPVHHDSALGYWHVFRHEDAVAVLGDHRLFSSDLRSLIPQPEAFATVARGAFLGFDPPRHQQLRTLVSKAFTPRLVAGLAPRIERIAGELLDALGGSGRTEFIEDFAYPLPLAVIADVLRIPVVDRARFRVWSEALFFQGRGDEPVLVATPAMLATVEPAIAEMNAYFLDIIRERRARPGDDLISVLTGVSEGGARLADEEILGVCGFLLVAGHITTTMLLSSALLLLADRPGETARLRADPALLGTAVEEVMRYRGQLPAAPRRTTAPAVVGGVTIPPDEIVMVWLASANLDERAFARADSFDIARTPGRHLALGRGIHYCLGAALARLELTVALRVLLRRWREFAVDGPVVFEDPRHTIGAKRLPLRVEWAVREGEASGGGGASGVSGASKRPSA